MAGPTPDAIETFVGITGASHSLAVRILEEHGGNLDAALNAHFSGTASSNMNTVPSTLPLYSPVDSRNQVRNEPQGILPVLSAARSFRPSLLLDPSYRRNLWNQLGASVLNTIRPTPAPPIPYASGYEQSYKSGARPAMQEAYGASLSNHVHPYGNMSRYDEPHPSDNNAEEEMVRRAIEASKQDIQTSSRAGVVHSELHLEDEELARAVSLSMKTAKEENAMRELVAKDHEVRGHDLSERAGSSGSCQDGSSSSREKVVVDEQLWSAMSSEELDEAILLETTVFSQNYGGSLLKHASVLPTSGDSSVSVGTKSAQNPLSAVQKERLSLREQQDNEYLASLLADKEKEATVLKKAVVSSPKEEGSSLNTVLDDVGMERLLAAKEALLPEEPVVQEENAVTLLLRMPDGSRHSRRFLKSDKLKCVFDFIDVGRAVQPGTYRVVRPYPRRAFSVKDSSLSLYEAGLNGKQEALFLEFI